MLKVRDESGQIIQGVVKDSLGNLVVNSKAEFDKYKKAQELATDIAKLKTDVAYLMKMVQTLLEHQQENTK